MKPDCKKITQVVNYLVEKQGGQNIEELKVIKLVWAADRYHLRKYARSVTGDKYVAMNRGPVGSSTKDVIEFETSYGLVDDADTAYSAKYFSFSQQNGDGRISSIAPTDTQELSETDIESLDFANDKLGHLSTTQLIAFTHLYPEWKKHEAALRESRKVADINQLDFFDNPTDAEGDIFAIDPEVLANTKQIYAEYA